VLLKTYEVLYLPRLQYITGVRVFGFLVITAVTRTLVEVNIEYTFTGTFEYRYGYYRYTAVYLTVYTSNLQLYTFEIISFWQI
jgi:hypothetical protein